MNPEIPWIIMPMFCLLLCCWHLLDWYCYYKYQLNMYHGFKLDYSQLIWYQLPPAIVLVSSFLMLAGFIAYNDNLSNNIKMSNFCLSKILWLSSIILVILCHYMIWCQKCFYLISNLIFHKDFEHDESFKRLVRYGWPVFLTFYSALWIFLLVIFEIVLADSESDKCQVSIKFWYYVVYLGTNLIMDSLLYITISNVCVFHCLLSFIICSFLILTRSVTAKREVTGRYILILAVFCFLLLRVIVCVHYEATYKTIET